MSLSSTTGTDPFAVLLEIAEKADTFADPKEAFHSITSRLLEVVGDKTAHEKPGALLPGETQFSVSGVFLLSPDRKHHVLTASVNFPEHQRRLKIDVSYPPMQQVMQNGKPLLIANTDESDIFLQYLETSRMGSVIYVPLLWRGEFFGQLVAAAQARNTFRAEDVKIMSVFAWITSLLWIACDGPSRLEEILAG